MRSSEIEWRGRKPQSASPEGREGVGLSDTGEPGHTWFLPSSAREPGCERLCFLTTIWVAPRSFLCVSTVTCENLSSESFSFRKSLGPYFPFFMLTFLVMSYQRRDWVGEITLVSAFIAGNFLFPSVSSAGRQMDAHTPQLVQFHWLARPRVGLLAWDWVAWPVQVSEWVREEEQFVVRQLWRPSCALLIEHFLSGTLFYKVFPWAVTNHWSSHPSLLLTQAESCHLWVEVKDFLGVVVGC